MVILTPAAFTLPQIERTSRRDILENCLQAGQLGMYGAATSGSTTTIVDTTKLIGGGFSARDWSSTWMRISKDAGGAAAAPEGEIRPVGASGYAPSTGTMTIATNAPAWTAAVAAGDIYQLWRYPHPQDVLDILDNLLFEEMYWPSLTLLSELPDHDFEQSTLTGHWGTASNVTATLATAEPLAEGIRYLSLVTTSAAGYLPSVAMNVTQDGTSVPSFFASALVRCSAASTTAKMIIYDETNAAAITVVGTQTYTGLGWGRLWFTFTLPVTCKQFTVRLSNVENLVTTYWDEIVLFPTSASDIALPWWVREREQIVGVFELNMRNIGTSVADPALIGEPTDDWDVRRNSFGRGQLRLFRRTGGSIGNRPLFILGKRSETAFANETTDLKHVNLSMCVAGVLAEVFSQVSSNETAGRLDMAWVRQKQAEWQRKWEQELRAADETIQGYLRSPNPERLYWSPSVLRRGYRGRRYW